MEWLNLARCAWRYKPQCHLALLRQNGLYPLCCLSSMHIIDKKSIAWLTKHLWLLPHISMPEDHNFLVAPRVLLELDHDSWIMLPLFSVWNSLSFALKDQQGFNKGSPSANVVNCTVHCVLSWPSLVVRVHTDFYPFSA